VAQRAALIPALVELADTLVADHDPIEYLYVLAERCVEVLDATAAGVLLVNGPRLDVAAASSHEMRVLEVFEAQQQQGPCIEAYLTGTPVSERALGRHAERWPDFVPRALELGYCCVHAQPLRLREERIGALNVFWSEPERFDADDELAAKGLADMASIGIMHERALTAAYDQIHHLRRALANRAVVEQAKILLAERLDADPGDAFDWLRRYARNHNQRLRDVAQRVLDGDLSARVFGPE
jgi:GAF domain-containing protein